MQCKTCISCCQTKSVNFFYKRKDSPDGYRNDCKECRIKSSNRNFCENRDEINRKKMERHNKKVLENPNFYAERYAKNKDKMRVWDADHYRQNKDRIKAKVKRWAEENRGKSNAIKKAYKAARSRACPPWARNDKALRAQMDEVYERAYKISIETGVKHHVDHVVPIRGKTVSGLHVPWNLQVLPGSENCRKSNRLLEEV